MEPSRNPPTVDGTSACQAIQKPVNILLQMWTNNGYAVCPYRLYLQVRLPPPHLVVCRVPRVELRRSVWVVVVCRECAARRDVHNFGERKCAHARPAGLHSAGSSAGSWCRRRCAQCGAAFQQFRVYHRHDGAMSMTSSSLLLAWTCVHRNQQEAGDSSNVEAVKQRLQGLRAGM
jgi:hypothetical protein